jgi:hypothetical protein
MLHACPPEGSLKSHKSGLPCRQGLLSIGQLLLLGDCCFGWRRRRGPVYIKEVMVTHHAKSEP